jgi:hypothetical protein
VFRYRNKQRSADENRNIASGLYFLSPRLGFLRLHYDALEGDNYKPHKPAAPEAANAIDFGAAKGFVRFDASNGWQTLTFHVADSAFANSENGAADFRFEITTPEIYVRRVSVTRDAAQVPPRP